MGGADKELLGESGRQSGLGGDVCVTEYVSMARGVFLKILLPVGMGLGPHLVIFHSLTFV